MRHLAWLHAKPEGSKVNRLTIYKDESEGHPRLTLPDIDTEFAAGYLIGLLQEAGLMSSIGMGPFPLSWAEIDAWLRTTQRQLTTWEKMTIKGLSEEYVNELVLATDKGRPAPYFDPDVQIDRVAVESKILNIARMFSKQWNASNEEEDTKEP